MNLTISLRSELLKIRRTAAFYFTLISAAAIPFTFLLNVLMDGIEETRKDPLNEFFKLHGEMNGLVIFPMFVILVCTLLPQIEYRNNTWKQVVTSPQSKGTVYLAKFLNVHLLLLLFLVATHLFMGVMIVAANFIDPTLDLFNQPLNGRRVLVNAANAYITALGLCSIQFWLGLRFRNFITPIAIGIACWLAGTLLVLEFHASYTQYFPYSFHIYALFPELKPQLNGVAWTSLCYGVIVLLLGFLDFRRRRLNG